MKIRILSDLHLDINKNYPFVLNDKDIFTIIAGDISANQDEAINWIKTNIHNGIIIEGNHIGYNSEHSIQYLEKQLEQKFSIDSNVSYLNNNYKIIDDYVFVGGILWTDYCLNGEDDSFFSQYNAINYMNDFRYNNYSKDEIIIRHLHPSDCIEMFNKTKNTINNICKKYPNKKIIVVTHHAPSIKSISPQYVYSLINSSYASNLEQFIIDNPNIVCWCHGHIHSQSDYKIGNCRVICNPRGYIHHKENKDFNSSFIVEI